MRAQTAMARRAVLALVAGGLLAGCSGLKPDPDAEAAAKLAYQRLAAGEDAALEAMMIPAARGPDDERSFAVMRHLIPSRAPASVNRTSWRAYTGTGGRVMTYVHAYDYGDRVVTAECELVPGEGGKGWRVRALHLDARPTGRPPERPSGVSI